MPKSLPSITLFLPAIIVYLGLFIFPFGLSLAFGLFVIGVLLGLTFFWWEMLFYIQTNPHFASAKQHLRQMIQQRQISQILTFFQNESEQVATVSRSYVFIGIYFIVAFFVITSTGSTLGVGMILGLGLRYCLDIVRYWQNIQGFNSIYSKYLDFGLNRQLLPVLRIVFLLIFTIFSLMVLL